MTDEHRLAPLRDKPAGQLLIHEIYRSLQGESVDAGRPCAFVRLAVCDARCRWCDTPQALSRGEMLAIAEVVERVIELDTPVVLITGGEPMLQPEALELMRQLCDGNLRVLLETNGAHDLRGVDPRVHIVMDIKCPDSGEHTRTLWSNLEALKSSDEVKLVVASRSDFDWAVEVVHKHGLESRVLVCFSPVWGAVEPERLATWLLHARLDARLGLQLHKLIWGPDARGV